MAIIGKMSLRLAELQESNKKAQKIRSKSLNKYKNVNRVLHHLELPFVPKIIQTEFISRKYNDSLIGHFDIDKTKEFIGRKYYWPSLRKNVEAYIKGCDICLTLKMVRYKPYGDLQALQVPNYR